MVKVYQHRFIKTMMISLTLILLVVLTLVNILNFYQLYQKANHKADYLIQHDGKLPYFNGTKKENGISTCAVRLYADWFSRSKSCK